MRAIQLISICLVGILITACGSTAILTPTNTVAPMPPTLTQEPSLTSAPTLTRTPLPTHTPQPSPTPRDCTLGWTRLSVDTAALVTGLASDPPIRVRAEASKSGSILTQIYPGTVVRVLEGPICADGLVFWKVENASIPGGSGWTAEGNGSEYWLEPYTAVAGTVRLSAYGVSFEVPGSWSSVPAAELVKAGSETDFCKWPDHIRITLTSYPVRSELTPILYVYETALSPEWFPVCSWIPELQTHKLALNRGDRHLLASMNAKPVFNNGLLYFYKGVTPDNAYTVYAFLPVNYPLLAESYADPALPAGGIPFDVNSQDWDAYYQAMSTQLEAAGNTDFTPSLDILDTLVESITMTRP